MGAGIKCSSYAFIFFDDQPRGTGWRYNKKSMKRFTLLLAFVSCFFMRLYAYDFSQETKDGQFSVTLYYAINPDEESVTIVQGPEKYAFNELIIPATVTHDGKTYTVTTIGTSAFQDCNISRVEMPNTITEIMSYAFKKSGVSYVEFSKGLKHIRREAFSHVSNLDSVILHDGLETIDEYAFYEDNSYSAGGLNYIYIPNSVYHIGNNAFAYQRHLVKVRLPEGLKTIEDGTFYYCSSLEHITLPKELETIGAKAFQSTHLRELEIPGKVRSVGDAAFQYTYLTSVTVPDNVEVLGEDAFYGCKQLTSITFSKGMKKIPESVCSYCDKLVDVKIPDGIEEVDYGAFQHCTLLSTVKFPESVNKMGAYVFGYSGVTRFTFPSQMTEIPQYTFSHCQNLSEYRVQEHITSIGMGAFGYCANLRKVTLPDGVEEIKGYVFEYCEVLEEINQPESITSIGERAFSDCVSLTDVALPSKLSVIEKYLFADCDKLSKISFPDSLKSVNSGAFTGCNSLVEVELPKGVEKLGDNVFGSCAALEKVTIPHSVKETGYVFSSSPNLSEVHLQRAILPTIRTNFIGGGSQIDTDNNCTLYVPRGAKAAYEASSTWNKFKEIVEEDVPDVYYSVVASRKKGRGTETVDGVNVSQVKELIAGSEITVMFAASEGYVIERILCNGEEIGSEAYGKQQYEYAIEAVETNYVFEVYYKEAPVVLKLKSGNGGSIDVMVEKGSTFTCNIVAEEGWIVNCVKFNYSDVTSKVADDGEYTTPAINGTSTLSVAFEMADGIESAVASNVKVYSLNDESIVVEGVENHNAIRVYATGGALLKEIPAAESYEVITLPTGDIYVVEACGKVMKIAL